MFTKVLSLLGLRQAVQTISSKEKLESTPNTSLRDAQLLAVLNNNTLTGSTALLGSLMSKYTMSNNVLQITMTLPVGYSGDPQAIHAQLVTLCLPIGIQEVNVQLVTQKKQATAAPASPLTPASKGTAQPAAHQTGKQAAIAAHPHIANIVLVASGKGGVGKSTTTVNLAYALQSLGLKVGVLDADIYGPSIPTMFGIANKTPLIEDEKFVPIDVAGMAVLSIANLLGDDTTPIIWRGPKATGALMQLFNQTLWPVLDVLLVDMPPGTGDIQLTMAQRIPVTGAIIVTTPQPIALLDAQKGIEMFNKVTIPVLGLVENMSMHTCSNCAHQEAIFGEGGAAALSKTYNIPVLGQLPLDYHIRAAADAGKLAQMNAAITALYVSIANRMLVALQACETPNVQRSNRII